MKRLVSLAGIAVILGLAGRSSALDRTRKPEFPKKAGIYRDAHLWWEDEVLKYKETYPEHTYDRRAEPKLGNQNRRKKHEESPS